MLVMGMRPRMIRISDREATGTPLGVAGRAEFPPVLSTVSGLRRGYAKP